MFFSGSSIDKQNIIKKIFKLCSKCHKLLSGGLGLFAFREVPSRRFAPSFVCFEIPAWIHWLRSLFSAWSAFVSRVGKVVNLPRIMPRHS